MRTSLIVSLLLLLSVALFAQATRIDATRLVKPSGTASRIYVTNSSGATEWATAAQILTAGSGISISGNTISTTGLIGGSGTAGQVAVFTASGTISSSSSLLFNTSTNRLSLGSAITSASADFHISNSNSGTTGGIRLQEGTDGANAWNMWVGGNGNYDNYLNFTYNNQFVFNVNPTQGMQNFRGFQLNENNGTSITGVRMTPIQHLNSYLEFDGSTAGANTTRLYGWYQIILGITNYGPDGGIVMRVTDQGRVGLLTVPTQTLDVNGGTRLRGALLDGLNTAGSSGQVLKSTGTATQWAADDNIGNTNLTLTANRTLTFGGFNLTYTTAANSFIIDASGATGTLVSPWIVRGKESAPATNALEYQDNAGTWRMRLRSTSTEARWLTNGRSTYIEGLNYIALNANANGENYWYWNDNATAQWAPRATDPTANNYSIWANSTATRFKYKATGAAKTVASLEDDIVGTYDLATGNITLGTNLKQEVDANAGAITVTVGSAMIEGVSYVFRCRRNGTNTVTLSAEGGYSIAIDGTNSIPGSSSIVLGGAGATGIQAAFKIYKLTRYGALIFLQ